MQVGISTASLFGRFNTEDALKFLSENGVPCAEVFLESYCEYNLEFAKLLNSVNKNTKIHSVHTLTTQFEPQLYSINERAQKDSFALLDMTMSSAKEFGAKCYTFHGGARFKKTPFSINYDRVGDITQRIIDVCEKHNICLAYENVHWGYYNYLGFFNEIRKRTVGLKATLDIKQARQSGVAVEDLIKEMGSDIVTVHLSDVKEDGKMALPGKGITDFNLLFKRLKDVGFDGALMLEVYKDDYSNFDQLFGSLEYVKNQAEKVFG